MITSKRLLNLGVFVFCLLPLIVTAAAMAFLPEQVVLHYGLSGPDQVGPKAELFIGTGIITACLLVCWLCMVFIEPLMAIQPWKNQSPRTLKRDRLVLAVIVALISLVYVGILVLIYFDSISL